MCFLKPYDESRFREKHQCWLLGSTFFGVFKAFSWYGLLTCGKLMVGVDVFPIEMFVPF